MSTVGTCLGLDVSRWQDDISTPQRVDFGRARQAGARFVFVKASQSVWLDRDFVWNWKAAEDAGLLRGAYHYLDWGKSASEQADFFCGVLAGDSGELPPVVDFECRVNAPVAEAARAALLHFLQTIEARLHVLPMIYSSWGYWTEYGSAADTWLKYPLWIANYGVAAPRVPAPWRQYEFWQFSDSGDGALYGVESKEVDLDYFCGTQAELYAKYGSGNPPAVPVSPPVAPSPGFVSVTASRLNVRTEPRVVEETLIAETMRGATWDVDEIVVDGQGREWVKTTRPLYLARWWTRPVP